MRVTNQMMSRNLLRNLNRNMQDMQEYQDQLSTGKKVQDPSDGPVAVTKVVKYKSDIRALEQYDKNVKDALSFTETSESAIADITNALDRARELAVQAANGTNTEQETKNIAEEMSQLKDHIIGNGNKTFAGKYIFSGYNTDQKLLKEDGTYNFDITQNDIDNPNQTIYEVGVGEDIKVSTNGIDLFGYEAENNYFTNNIPSDSQTGAASSQSILKGDFDLTQDYTGDNLDITFGGNVYTVDETGLDGSTNPINKKDVLSALQDSENAGTPLSDVANVYYNADDELVIQAKNHGNIGISTASGTFNPSLTNGTDVTEANIVGTNNIADGDIASQTGTYNLEIGLNDKSKTINIDMSALNNANDFDSAVQNAVDSAFGANKLDVNISDGNPFEISTINSSEGLEPTLEVSTIKTKQPKLMKDLDDFITALENSDNDGMNKFIGNADEHLNNLNSERSIIGAKTNRMELILSRIEDDNINVTQLLSNAQDVDMSEAIMNMKNRENVYRAALSTGAKTIQPSLIDFLR